MPLARSACTPLPIDRRDFLRRAAALGTALPFVGLARQAAAQQAELVARRVFFDNPDYSNVRVSPDGEQLAWLAPLDGVNNLWVAPVADPGAARPVTRVTDRNISTYYPLGLHQPPSGVFQRTRR